LARIVPHFYAEPKQEFLHNLIQTPKKPDVRQLVRDTTKRFVDGQANQEVSRVAGKFAVLAVAGELATEWGLTGWEKGEAESAITRIFQAWRAQRGERAGDVEIGLRQVREFFQRYSKSRLDWPGRKSKDTVGFVETTGKSPDEKIREICVYPELFRSEVCKNYDAGDVLKALRDEGSLIRSKEKDGRYTVKRDTPDGNQRRVLAFNPSVTETERDW